MPGLFLLIFACTKFHDFVSVLLILLNPELTALVTKNKEILERYKGLVQSNYKEPTNGNFDVFISSMRFL